jgi:hypothetical protein
MLVDHWPTLRPPSLPIPAKIGTLFHPLPGSLQTFGWRLDPNYKIRHDPPPRAEYPFEYSPPISPLGDLEPLLANQSPAPTGPFASPFENLSLGSLAPSGGPSSPPVTLAAAPNVPAKLAESPHSLRALPVEQLSFLTLNVRKAGRNSPSLEDIISLLDLHTPYFVPLTETPLLPCSGTLTHMLRNVGYKIHYHPINAPSPPDTLPEARLPDRLAHPGGGCWIAYIKYTNWATQVRPLRIPTDFPPATTCAVEITLRSGDKAAIIASYLPQSAEEHERAC